MRWRTKRPAASASSAGHSGQTVHPADSSLARTGQHRASAIRFLSNNAVAKPSVEQSEKRPDTLEATNLGTVVTVAFGPDSPSEELAATLAANGHAFGATPLIVAPAAAYPPPTSPQEACARPSSTAALNHSIERALRLCPSAPFLLLVSSTSRLEPGCVDRLVTALERYPDAMAALPARRVDGGRIEIESVGLDLVRATRCQYRGSDPLGTELLDSRTTLLRTEILRAGLRYDEGLVSDSRELRDLDFSLALAHGRENRQRVLLVPDAVAGDVAGSPEPTDDEVREAADRTRIIRRWAQSPKRATLRHLILGTAARSFAPHRLAHHLAGTVAGLRKPTAPPRPLLIPPPSYDYLVTQMSGPDAPTIGIVILTRDTREDTLACLARLLPQLGANDRVLVADNGSTDGTEALVRKRFPEVEYLQHGADLGVAGGCDPALAQALIHKVDWVLLLDHDARADDGFIADLREVARHADGAVGAIQPLLVDRDDPTRVVSAGLEVGTLPSISPVARRRLVRRLRFSTARPAEPFETVPIFGASGAAMLLRRRALRDVGLLDPGLYSAFEDADLMFRLRSTGWDVRLAPRLHLPIARARNRKAGSRQDRATRRFWEQRNLVTLAIRWWPTLSLVTAAPRLALYALRAVHLARRLRRGAAGPAVCMPMWRRASSERRENRPVVDRTGTGRWFGQRSVR